MSPRAGISSFYCSIPLVSPPRARTSPKGPPEMAIAELPPQSARHDRTPERGIRFARTFTHDGVHPYDEIAWERRDAVIPGEGGNVFEQKGVEVPAFWSMTA